MSHATPHGPTQDGCRYCWMCRHVCPTGFATKRETHTPHGYALLVASVQRGVTAWDADTVDALYHCADCGACESHCATHQPLPEAIVEARVAIAAGGQAPKAAADLQARFDKWGTAYGDPGPRPVAARGEVGLFVGDALPHLGPATVEAARTLLARAGVDAVVVGAGRSSGLVASALGFQATATALARDVLADVEASGCRELLVLTPGDRFAFERAYSTRLGLTWPAGVVVREALDVVADAYADGRVAFQPPPMQGRDAWAYQEPDHAVRVGPRPAPRALLTAAFGAPDERRLFRRDERAHPCGTAGGLDVTQPALSAALADARLADARTAGARRVYTEDPACLRHLRGRPLDGLEVLGVFEALTERLV